MSGRLYQIEPVPPIEAESLRATRMIEAAQTVMVPFAKDCLMRLLAIPPPESCSQR